MQSDQQPIDDFFRTKEQAFVPGTGHMSQHWQQLKAVQATQLLQAFYSQLDQEEQVFTIIAEKASVVTGAAGTRLQIPANCFTGAHGTVQGPVQITLQEFYVYPDIIAARLGTRSNDRQLVTGGMVFLKALANGEEVMMASDKTIRINMPTAAFDERMQLFTGAMQDHDRSTINWIAVEPPKAMEIRPQAVIKKDSVVIGAELMNKLQQHFKTIYSIKKQQRVQQGDDPHEESTPEVPSMPEMNNKIRDWISSYVQVKRVPRSTYRFTITNLGWINCDRYMDHPKTSVSVKVHLKEEFDAPPFSQLVFTQQPSIVNGQATGNTIQFDNIPEHEPVLLILTGIKEGKTVGCLRPVNVSAQPIDNLVFEPVTPGQFKEQLATLFPR